MVKNLFTKKAGEPDDLRGEFYQIFQEPIILPYTIRDKKDRESKGGNDP